MTREEYVEILRKRRRRTFFTLYASIVIIVGSSLLLIYQEELTSALNIVKPVFYIISIVLFIVAAGFILNFYLTFQPVRFDMHPRDLDQEDPDVNQIFNKHILKNILDKYGYGYDQRGYYREDEEEQAKPYLFEDDISEIKKKFISQLTYELRYSSAFEDLTSLEKKLRGQIDRLVNNSNLNLIIGTITTIIAVSILAYSIFGQKKFESPLDLSTYYIPRISTVIFVEIFSFFFLKLYRKNLDEIKYFQNEITNLNFKMSALKVSLATDNKETTPKILTELSSTERNFILKKGETTERIETEKLESKTSTKLFENLNQWMKNIGGKSS